MTTESLWGNKVEDWGPDPVDKIYDEPARNRSRVPRGTKTFSQPLTHLLRSPNEKAMHENRVARRLTAKKAKKAQMRRNRK